MAVEMLLPGRRIPAPKPPSYLALDMAFGVGNPAILGDKSIYRSHGTIVGAVPAAGVHGYCLDFDPTIPSYVVIPAAHTQLDFTSEDFSLISRVYIDSLAVSRELFCRGLANVDGYYSYIHDTGRLDVQTCQTPGVQSSRSSPGGIVIGTWYTLGWSRTGASIRTYVNGLDDTTVAGVHIDPLTSARSAKIGIYDNLIGSPYDGRMEFLRIFRGIALQPSEHLAWHNALA